MKLGLALATGAALAMLGCGEAPPPKPTTPQVTPLHVSPLTDLAPAASLAWLIEVHPQAILGDRSLSPVIASILPNDQLRAFAREWGGLDLREADTLVFASYPSTLLSLAHQAIDPRRVEAAFTSRAQSVEGRSSNASTGVTRVWGTVGARREQLAILGAECIGLEQGRFGPLRTAELFAEGRLRRASPALHAAPLARAAELLGEAPARAFAPGPFEGDLQRGAGGLIGASTAIAASVRVSGQDRPSPGLRIHILILGAWGAESGVAADKLRAVFDVLAASGVGRLLGLFEPVARPSVEGSGEALSLDVTIDAAVFARGLRATTAAEASEIMGIL